jgi:hypothetical protein
MHSFEIFILFIKEWIQISHIQILCEKFNGVLTLRFGIADALLDGVTQLLVLGGFLQFAPIRTDSIRLGNVMPIEIDFAAHFIDAVQ